MIDAKRKEWDIKLRDAIRNRDLAQVQALLSDGAGLTMVDKDGKTPLMVAAMTGVPEMVEVLLRAGADVTPKDKFGFTAEMTAYWHGEYRMGSYTPESLKIVAMLREKGSPPARRS